MYNTIKVVIADDHEIFRNGLAEILKKEIDFELLGEAENGIELLKKAEKLKPDVVLTDIKMPEMDGIEATKQLSEKFPEINVVALSMYDEDNIILEMMEAGAKGYLSKNAHRIDIIEAIKSVHRDEIYYSKETSDKLIRLMGKRINNSRNIEKLILLNEKELEIVGLVCKQFTNKEMSEKLHLSVRTIEGYRNRLQEKLGVKNAAGIVVYAIKNKLFEV